METIYSRNREKRAISPRIRYLLKQIAAKLLSVPYFLGFPLLYMVIATYAQSNVMVRFPADRAVGVNPDTQLTLTFPAVPVLGKSGSIRVYDASNDRLVD